MVQDEVDKQESWDKKPEKQSNVLLWIAGGIVGILLLVLIVADTIPEPVGVVEDSNVSVSDFTLEHAQLALNQQAILNEVRLANQFRDCIVDVNGISSGELPIDNAGGFRRVSIVPLICPEIQGAT